jgi:hypothetical protein
MKQRDMQYTGGVKKWLSCVIYKMEKKEIYPTVQRKEFMGSNYTERGL